MRIASTSSSSAGVVLLPVPLALEAERLVQAHRGLVPREDVQLELAIPDHPRPARPPPPAASSRSLAGGGSAATISPRSATWRLAGMRIAREREPTDDARRRRRRRRRRRPDAEARSSGIAARRRSSASPRSRGSSVPRSPSDRLARARRGRPRRSARRVGCESRDDHSRAAAPRIAGGRERAVRPQLDRLDAAEVEVETRPAHDLPRRRRATRSSRPSRPRDGASRRRRACAARRSPRRRASDSRDDAPRDLGDRAGEADRAGAPEQRGADARPRGRASGSAWSADVSPARAARGR